MLSGSLFEFEFRKHNPAVMCFRGGVLVYNRDINKGGRERGFPPLTTVNQQVSDSPQRLTALIGECLELRIGLGVSRASDWPKNGSPS